MPPKSHLSNGNSSASSSVENHYKILLKSPTNRDKPFPSLEDWLQGKACDDGAEGLWRIHDGLYDLSEWSESHPGGSDWITLTKGTDITEAFESHHISDKAEQLLPKFYVRQAKVGRNSLLTFHKDGFYMTLKRRVREELKETGPTFQSKLYCDGLILASFACGMFATWWGWPWAVLAGSLVAFGVIASHNFFHAKDNWRMYYFNLSLMSYKDWRISHALSHHMFPNTKLDLEVTFWEPFIYFLPQDKNSIFRYAPWVLSPIYYMFMFAVEWLVRIANMAFNEAKFSYNYFMPLATPVIIAVLSGSGLDASFQVWTIMVFSSSFVFGLIGLTAAHHHPEIYHEGDYIGEDKDFGIFQLAAVRNRSEVTNSFLVLISFGDHNLHHLFPTVDHFRLPALYPVFERTCKEFGIAHESLTSLELAKGMYQQIARIEPNNKLPIMQ